MDIVGAVWMLALVVIAAILMIDDYYRQDEIDRQHKIKSDRKIEKQVEEWKRRDKRDYYG